MLRVKTGVRVGGSVGGGKTGGSVTEEAEVAAARADK